MTTHCGSFATYGTTPVAVSCYTAKDLHSFRLTHEQTIRAAVTCAGVGLHSGARVSLRILPAAAGTGIVFHRTDLEGFPIEASGRNVARVSYATSLMKKGVLISTTEHLLSAFTGLGIDNAIVEIDNLELPILDGSAQPFVEMIQKAGIRKQRKARTYLRIVRDIELREGQIHRGLSRRYLFRFLFHQFPASPHRQTELLRTPHQWQLSERDCSGANFRIFARG